MYYTNFLAEATKFILSLWLEENDYSDNERCVIDDLISINIYEYGWEQVFGQLCNYLYTMESNDDCMIKNFILHLYDYIDYLDNQNVPDLIHFIAYIYYKIDTIEVEVDSILDEQYWSELIESIRDECDDIAYEMFAKVGILANEQDLTHKPYLDPRIQAEIAKIKASKEKTCNCV